MNTGAYDVLSEHQHIRRLVDSLEISLEKRGQGGRDWLDELAPVLGELATGLNSHFKGEEAEFFVDVSKRLPRHSATVERLMEQHRRLAQDFGLVAGQVATLDLGRNEAIEEFAHVLSKSLKLLRTHEEQENELMLVAYWQDLGEAD
jgi:hemerythrin-like domain-containing protein